MNNTHAKSTSNQHQIAPDELDAEFVQPEIGPSYQITIQGRLDEHWTEWFEDLGITLDEHGNTLLSGVIPDQASLHGILAKIRDLGLPLLSLVQLGPETTGKNRT
jgi:hypothetical protein